MDTLLSILAVIFGVVGCIGCIVPVLPGVALAYAGYVCLYFCSYAEISVAWLIVFGVLTAIVSILDYILPSYMTKKFGGSKRAAWGATIGVLVGLFLGPVGVLFCPFCGALIGELSLDSKDSTRAFRAAFGSFAAFIFGVGLKLACCIAIAVPLVKSIF